MSKKVKVAVIACILAYICAVTAVICVLLMQPERTEHIEAERNLNLSLFRDGYSMSSYDKNGNREEVEDNTRTDFSGATDKNVFGLTNDTVIIPGSSFQVNMTISNNSENSVPFAYWLSIEVSSEINALADQLDVTVTVGGRSQTFPLTEGYVFGGEASPLAYVGINETSSFSVKLEYDKYKADNTSQGKTVYFDLIVHAVEAQNQIV